MIKKIDRIEGFSLIELMISVAIIGILAGIAYPSYTEYVLKGKRGDAKAALLSVQLAQEKYRANNTAYGSTSAIGITSSPDGYYSIAVSGESSTAYIVTATPGHTDAYCTTLVINQDGTKSATGTDAAHCW